MEDFINAFIMVGIIFCILAIQILTGFFILWLIKKQSVNNIKPYNYDRNRAFGFSVKRN